MNTEQLYDLIAELVEDEDREKIQQKLQAVVTALGNLANSPQDTALQTTVAQAMDELNEATNLAYTPLTSQRMEEIGAQPYFSTNMVDRIRQSMSENPMTPAVVQKEAEDILSERESLLSHLRNAEDSLEAMGVSGYDLDEGEAEIGFEIPRHIFANDLEGFSRELHELRLIIRAFSEAAGNAGEDIEVRQISTTDPLIYLGLGYLTILKIGAAVKWCLDQWKTIEEIRNLRTTTANLKDVPAAAEMVEKFDAIIDQIVETRVRGEAELLANEANVPAERKNELANHLAIAITGLLARIERGMKVDIRILPPPTKDDEEKSEVAAQFEQIAEIRDDLVFPAIGTEKPILKIEKMPEQSSNRQKKGLQPVNDAEIANEPSRSKSVTSVGLAARPAGRHSLALRPSCGMLAHPFT